MNQQYPSAEEVKQRIAKRKQLAQELIGVLMLTNKKERDKRLKLLEALYGQSDVERELAFHRRQANLLHNLGDEKLLFYSEYVNFYRRFGGNRPFLSMAEYSEANNEAAPLIIRSELGQPMTAEEQDQLAYLSDLLLKEMVFCDDLLPENPPANMPDVNLPATRKTAPKMAAGLPLSSYPLCPDDGFPLIWVNGKLVCSVETLDGCVGGKKVVDVVRRGRRVWYVFEDGHQLPLLCGCCGNALEFSDITGHRQQMIGRHLSQMGMETMVIKEEDREYDQLILEFHEAGPFSQPLQMDVAFESIAAMRHPSAETKKLPTATKKTGSGQKKRTSRRKRKK